MIHKILELLDPYYVRSIATRLIQKFDLGSYEQRLKIGAVARPHYGYCVYNAAILAGKLGYEGISVLEFGVAGGKGLLNLELHAQRIEELSTINIDVYGFDTGEGLPEPVDYRDLPHNYQKSFYKMDIPRLKSRLKKAKLILGDVRHTLNGFFEEYNPRPIGAIMFDLDYYSSTAAALAIFDSGERYFLPRVFCYFDDTLGSETALMSDYTGQRLAIREFNQSHERQKLGIAYCLFKNRVIEPWYRKIWIYHDFEHSRYNTYIGRPDRQLALW